MPPSGSSTWPARSGSPGGIATVSTCLPSCDGVVADSVFVDETSGHDSNPGTREEPRRKIAGMLAAMDEAVGQIVAAITANGMRERTLFVFASDNGGDPTYGASNAPFAGGKKDLAEGGVRVPAFVVFEGRLAPGLIRHTGCHTLGKIWSPTSPREG